MALSPKLELRQSQSLVMTPQLMQAIKLLQLSSLDLAAYVEAELERNPLLEREEPSDQAAAAPGESLADPGHAADWPAAGPATSAEIVADRLDADLSNVFQDEPRRSDEVTPAAPAETWASPPTRQALSGEDYNIEAFVAERRTLADHLTEQLNLAFAGAGDRLIGRALIDEIDDNGYLRADLDALALRLGADRATVDGVLARLQTFEPTGIFARDLAECLALQLAECDRLDPAMAAMLANLDLVARRDFASLRRLCGVDDDDLAQMLSEIRALDPRPAAAFDPAPVQTVVPDVLVHPAPDGGWRIELNPETLPRVLVNQSYYATIATASRRDADRAYVSDCLQSANWLVKSLDQRAKTILKVTAEIVRQQDGFLANGVQYLRPLNLKTVADAISMHESTVSRVTSNKYMATTRGIFELKYFFTTSIASAEGGEAHSAEAVRHRIRSLIDAESPDDVLSDDALVKMLRQSGIDIARRTVAKYREAMHIPSSVHRRRDRLEPA